MVLGVACRAARERRRAEDRGAVAAAIGVATSRPMTHLAADVAQLQIGVLEVVAARLTDEDLLAGLVELPTRTC